MNKDKEQLILEFYDMYYDDLYRFILFMIGDEQCCEDIVHDTFVRAYTAVDRFQYRSNIKTWLFSIAKHLVVDEIRKRKRRRLLYPLGIGKEVPSTINVERYIENKEAVINLMVAINQLNPNYRLVIILKKLEECSTKEIAEILNWSEEKVRKTLSRAVHSLRKMKEIEGGEHIEQSFR